MAGRMNVRPARHCDRLDIVDLGRAFSGAAGVGLPFCPDHVSRLVARCIADPARLALVLEVEGRAVGALLAVVGESPLAPVFVSQELAWWVSPSARGHAADLMLDFYEDWARAQGCVAVGLACLSDPRVARWYRMRGYVLMESHFVKGL